MSLIGKKIKSFNLNAFRAGEDDFLQISDEQLKDRWSVLFFYPADFTFVCPTELEDLADNYEEFLKLGVEVFSVSTDSHWTHKAWHEKSDAVSKVKFTMVSDDQFKLSKQFKVLRKNEGRSDRATFVIDPNGQIQAYEITSEGGSETIGVSLFVFYICVTFICVLFRVFRGSMINGSTANQFEINL